MTLLMLLCLIKASKKSKLSGNQGNEFNDYVTKRKKKIIRSLFYDKRVINSIFIMIDSL